MRKLELSPRDSALYQNSISLLENVTLISKYHNDADKKKKPKVNLRLNELS